LACDPNRWSYFEILGILKEMGYANVKEMWYAVGGGSVLEGRLELLSDDRGACHMVNIATLNGQVHLYVVHKVDEAEVVNLLEYHPVVEEGDVREGLQVQNEDDGGEVDEGVQVQSEEDGGQVDVLVEIVIEEHGGEVDVPVEIVIEEHGGEVVEAIRTYGVHNGRKLKIFRNDKRRICVKCLGAKGTCKWYAYCAYKSAQST